MRRVIPLCVAIALTILAACNDAPPADRASPESAAPTQTTRTATTSPAAELVVEGVQALLDHYYQPPDAGRLFADAWDGAASAVYAAGAKDVPKTPTFPTDAAAAATLYRDSFLALERSADGRLSAAAIAAAALHALAVGRDDPHTSYRPRELVQRDQATRQSDAAVQLGLGFSRSSPPSAVRVPPGSPAEKAGLRAGHVIVAVNGTPVTRGADIPAIVDVRAGVPNTFTTQDAQGRTVDHIVMPEQYVRPIEEHRVIDGRIGVIRLYGFPATEQVIRRLREALTEFERQGVEGWILDLRDNGGGPIETVIAVASLFLDGGPLFEEQHRGQTLQTTSAEGQAFAAQRPLVTLVGPGSFSGGEILPAVLRSRGRADAVGEQTGGGFGSSVAVPLSDGSALNVTTTEVVIGPDRQRLNRVGLTPDLVVASTPEDIEAGRDPQLDAALRLLGEQLRR
ncbi:MAG: S41 family peptidase [Dehalococcoidia bacterium]